MAASSGPDLLQAFLAEIKSAKVFFYNTVVAQAHRVDVTVDGIVFAFLASQKVPRQQCDDARVWLEGLAAKVMGTRVPVRVKMVEPEGETAAAASAVTAAKTRDAALDEEALANPTVQALLEIFPVEKTQIEEM